MNEHSIATLKVIAALAIGFAANFSMTLLAAPGNGGIAVGVGVLLTALGLVFAKFVLDIVLLPVAVISLVLRLVRGKKLIAHSPKNNDRIGFFGRVLFVLTLGFVSAITGIFIGAMEGGMGWFTSSALFGTIGMLLAILMPEELMWATEHSETLFSEPTAAGNADIEQARKDGNPTVLFADKFAKKVIDVLVEKPGPDNKP